MDCYRARTLLGAYLDGEIVDWDVVRDIEVHLADGQACAEDVQALQALIASIREKAPYFKAPEDLASRIKARVRDKES
jgi:predicted anti-sigma-YlaC factor YlaD